MDIQSWIPYATFITLLITIISYISGKTYLIWRRSLKKAQAEENLSEKLKLIEECATDIHALQSYYRTIAGNIQEINKHGSEGANSEFKVVHGKLDKLCRKINRVNGRLVRVEEHLNGGLGTAPRYDEDDETE